MAWLAAFARPSSDGLPSQPIEVRQVGTEIGIDWTSAPFDVQQFRMGMDVELEHGLRQAHREGGRPYPRAVSWFRYAAAVAVAAVGGGAATRRSVSTWYPGLRKPNWTPPSQVFGPVWTVLYAQMAYSATRVARSSDPGRGRALALWWLQMGLNAGWSPVFFGARRTGVGAVVIGALVPAVAATAAASARVDRRAGLLYAPYLAWSTYAAALNLEIWRRNRS